jgi:hypothetical protein
LCNAAWGALGFVGRLIQSSFVEASPGTSHSPAEHGTDLKTDPVALALFDEKGTDWCSNSPGAPRGARMLPFVKMKKQAVPARFADFVEVEVLNDGANEHVWVNFDKALRCGIDKILDNGGTAMDDDARAWTAIINSYERAWPDCGASAMSDSRMTGCL